MSETTIRIIAAFAGLVISLFVVSTIVLTYRLGRKRTAMGWLGLTGGTAIIAGIAIFRVHMASDRSDYLIAIGLAIIELGAILTLEWVAGHQRRLYSEWTLLDERYQQAKAKRDAAEIEMRKRRHQLNETCARIRRHIQMIEERTIRRVKAPELEDAGMCATRAGYYEGIAENRKNVQEA